MDKVRLTSGWIVSDSPAGHGTADAISFSSKKFNMADRLVTRDSTRAVARRFFSPHSFFRYRLKEPDFAKDKLSSFKRSQSFHGAIMLKKATGLHVCRFFWRRRRNHSVPNSFCTYGVARYRGGNRLFRRGEQGYSITP